MRGRGQAARALMAVPVWTATALLSAVLFALAGVAALEWRLSRDPLPLPWLAHWAEATVNRGAGTAAVRVGAASVGSAAWRDGPDAPLRLAVADAAALEPGGKVIAAAMTASATVAIAPLLAGEIRPRMIGAEDVRLRLRRRADGGIGLDTGEEPSSRTVADGDTGIRQILRALAGSPAGEAGGRRVSLAGIERVAIRGIDVSVVDEGLDATWKLGSGTLELARQQGGGIAGAGDLAVALGGETARLDLTAAVDPGAATTHARLRVHPVNPAVWSGNVPKLAALAVLNAPVSAELTGEFGPDLDLRQVGAEATIAAGRTRINDAEVAVLRGSLRADGTPDRITLNEAELVVRGRPESTPSTLSLRGAVERAPPGLVASGGLDLDRVAFADLGLLWPKAAGTNARRWVTENMTDGIARDAHVDFTLTTPPDFSDVRLTGATGSLEGDDLTVYWLRPVPPIDHGQAHLRILDPDTIEIAVTGGRQRPSAGRIGVPNAGLQIRGGTIRITGIERQHQFGAIVADIGGPLPDALGLLSEKRLRLLSEHPIGLPLDTLPGTVDVKLTITVPLEDAVQIEQIPIRALARIDGVAIPNLFAGESLEQGVADLDVTADGMSALGSATVAQLPVDFAGAMDFRAGPPSQILERVTVTGRGSIDQLARAGIDARSAMSGLVALKAQLVQCRNGQGVVEVAADLTGTVLTAAPLDWQKSAGSPAQGRARVRLLHGRLAAVDDIVVTGPDLAVRGEAAFAEGKPALLRFAELKVGRSEMTAQVRFPPKPRAGPIAATLAGPTLDVSSRLSRQPTASEPKPAQSPAPENTPWSVSARFDRVLTGSAEGLSAVAMAAENDGRRIRRLHAEARAGAAGRFRADIVPDGANRRLDAAAEGVGTVLGALGVTDGIEGGTLTVSGRYDDARPGRPLTAELRMGPFRITDAPFSARLLKAITIYGIADLLRGPGIGVSDVVAPFTLTGDRLQLGDSRAVSPALGVTARGAIDLDRRTADIRGTIVPAYFLNSLPGRIPGVGRLFSPEAGGGLFAADYTLRGSLDDPSLSVNPLSLLTPGALRGLFGN